MMKMPSDISADFEGSWEEFVELPATKSLEPLVREEAFRILLQQARIKVRTLKTVSDFITVNTKYAALIRRVNLAYMLYHLAPQHHRFGFEFKENAMTNVVHFTTIKGEMKLKPSGHVLQHLLNRLVTLKVFKSMPTALSNGRYRSRSVQLRDYDFVNLFACEDFVLKVARIKGDYLILRYEVYFENALPMYNNLEKQLYALWRRASIGDFK